MSEKIRRYPGGRPFTREMAGLFYGRKKDILQLHRLVSLEPLVVLYGKSGLGKSSLINAGLIPKLEEKSINKSLQLRFTAWTGESSQSPLKNTYDSISKMDQDNSILDKVLPGDETLWQTAKSFQMAQPKDRLILMFDQFEELFSYPQKQIDQFKKQLAELLRGHLPKRYERILDVSSNLKDEFLTLDEEDRLYESLNIRILFIIRSDKMHLLDQLSDYLPTILKNNHELLPLSEAGATDALLEPAKLKGSQFISPAFAYDKPAEKKIISFLKDDETEMVEAIQLQILCTSFEDNVIANNWTLLDEQKTGDLKSIVENYYHNKLKFIEDPSERLLASKLLEDGLVDSGRQQRLTLHESQIMDLFGVEPSLLNALVNIFLLRRELDQGGGYNYELSHDTLVAPVLTAREVRQKIEAEEEYKKQEILLEEERKKIRRARLFSIGAGILALFALGAMALALFAMNQTQISRDDAKRKAEVADSTALVADSLRIESDSLYDIAIDAQSRDKKSLEKAETSEKALAQSVIKLNESLVTAQLAKEEAIKERKRATKLADKATTLVNNLTDTSEKNSIDRYFDFESANAFRNREFKSALAYLSLQQFFGNDPVYDKYIKMIKQLIKADELYKSGFDDKALSQYDIALEMWDSPSDDLGLSELVNERRNDAVVNEKVINGAEFSFDTTSVIFTLWDTYRGNAINSFFLPAYIKNYLQFREVIVDSRGTLIRDSENKRDTLASTHFKEIFLKSVPKYLQSIHLKNLLIKTLELPPIDSCELESFKFESITLGQSALRDQFRKINRIKELELINVNGFKFPSNYHFSSHLKKLVIKETDIATIPDKIFTYSEIESLTIDSNHILRDLPLAINDLELQELNLLIMSSDIIPNPKSLEKLTASYYSISFDKIDWSRYKKLKELTIRYPTNFRFTESFYEMKSLEKLTLIGLQFKPNLEKLKSHYPNVEITIIN